MQPLSQADSIGRAIAQPSLPAAFLAQAADHPGRIALRSFGSDEELSLREWAERARAVAGGLRALGVRRGDRVALLLTTRIEFHILDMGALLIGAIPFSLYATSSLEQLIEILDNARPRVLITEAALADTARTLLERHFGISHLVVADSETASEQELNLVALEALCPADFDVEASAAEAQRDDVCTLVYTSGTTGAPKGVQFRHGGMLDCLSSIRRRFTATSADRALSYLPMAHIAERIFGHYAAFVYGYEVTSVPDISRLPEALTQVRPTRFFGVPRIYEKTLGSLHRLMSASPDSTELEAELASRLVRVRAGSPAREDERSPDILAPLREATGLDQAHFLAVAGAPSSLDVLEELTAFGFPINELYGASEIIVVAGSPPDRIKLGTVGTAFPGTRIRLGEDGEVLVAGPTVMPGYYRDPERTAEVLDDDGWLHTGDIGTMDQDGYLRIVDRKKALIINSSGKNMSPSVIEQAIKGGQPLISQVLAIGDRRPYNVALIVLDRDAVAGLAQQHGLSEEPFDKLTQHPVVLDAVTSVVSDGNQRLSRVEQIKRFHVLDHEWAPGSDFLTPTSKLKRAPIQRHYENVIEELYT